MKEKGIWNAPTAEEQIVALEAKEESQLEGYGDIGKEQETRR